MSSALLVTVLPFGPRPTGSAELAVHRTDRPATELLLAMWQAGALAGAQ